jgi:hypothetical protein
MEKKYLSKIIANDNEGLQMISACCAGAEIETENEGKKVNSICKFEFVDSVKSKNIKQDDIDQKLDLITMDYLKNNNNYEINLIFTNNAYITLSTEIIEVTLDDQNKID